MDFPKKQQQCLIPKYLLDYTTELQNSHPDPTEDWGGSGSTYEAGTGIDITENVISVDSSVAMKEDIPDVSDFITENEVDTKLEDYELKADAFSGSYTDLTDKPDLSVYELKSEAFSGDYDDLTNKPDLSVYALSSSLASVATTGDYDDLIDKPDLSVYAETSDLGDCAYLDENELSIAYSQITGTPTIPTKTSELTNDSGYITSSALPTNYVTTDTVQNITGEKTFVGNKKLKFKQSTSSEKLGFTLYDNSTNEKGYLEYNPTNSGLYLGRYGNYGVTELGFLNELPGSSGKHKVLVPNTYRNGNTTDYIVTSINNTRADDSGNVSITIPDTSNFVTTNTAQTIAGQKTFNSNILLYKNRKIQSNIDDNDDTTYVNIINAVSTSMGGIIEIGNTGSGTRIYGSSRPTIYFISGGQTTSGAIATLADIPTVPTNVSAFTNDAGYITGITGTMVNNALGYTAADAANVPSSATSTSSSSSTSTVTPSTITLTFTYSDNTTENVTLMTGASVATTTTTTTTTTLS